MPKRNHQLMKKAIGNVIERRRNDMGLNQEELGKLVYNKPKKQKTISDIECGSRGLPAHEITGFTKTFKISYNQLFSEILKEFKRISQ